MVVKCHTEHTPGWVSNWNRQLQASLTVDGRKNRKEVYDMSQWTTFRVWWTRIGNMVFFHLPQTSQQKSWRFLHSCATFRPTFSDRTNKKLENVAIAMHCNLRPPDAEPVIFRFNWAARATFEVGQPWTYLLMSYKNFYWWYLTLCCDLWPLTFLVYRMWRVETLYQIWAKSNNPRQSYCDLNIEPYGL